MRTRISSWAIRAALSVGTALLTITVMVWGTRTAHAIDSSPQQPASASTTDAPAPTNQSTRFAVPSPRDWISQSSHPLIPTLGSTPRTGGDSANNNKEKNNSAEVSWPRTSFEFEPSRHVPLETPTGDDKSQESAGQLFPSGKALLPDGRIGGGQRIEKAFSDSTQGKPHSGEAARIPSTDTRLMPRLSQPQTFRELMRADGSSKANPPSTGIGFSDDAANKSNPSQTLSATPRVFSGRFPIPGAAKTQESSSNPSGFASPYDPGPQNATEYFRRALDPRALGPGGEARAYRALMDYGRSLNSPNFKAPAQTATADATTEEGDEADQTKRRKAPITNFGFGSSPHSMRYSLDKSYPDQQSSSGGPATSHSPGSIMPAESLNKERPFERSFERYQENPFPEVGPGR